MAYQLEGRLLEVCNCKVLCPCWVGENPDFGACESILAWHVDQGTIEGVDVSGLTIASFAHIPRNVLEAGSWKVAVFVDANASPAQMESLLNVWTGKLGGPVADLAQLIGEVAAVEQVPIAFTVDEGQGTVRIGAVGEATMAPFVGATGQTTTLSETVFSTIPGSPAYASKASNYQRNGARYGMPDVNLSGHNAVQGHFKFVS